MREKIEQLIKKYESAMQYCGCRASCDCGKGDKYKMSFIKDLKRILSEKTFGELKPGDLFKLENVGGLVFAKARAWKKLENNQFDYDIEEFYGLRLNDGYYCSFRDNEVVCQVFEWKYEHKN